MPEPTGLTQTFFGDHARLDTHLSPYRSDATLGLFFGFIDNKDYIQALHQICKENSVTANAILPILLQFKDPLSINLDAQIGEAQKTALHHVAIKQNRVGYGLLTEAGANTKLKDSHEKAAIDYLLFEPLPRGQRGLSR